MPRAASLAAAIEKHLGVKPVLEKGGGGVFDVLVDGKLLFSKHAAGRFPQESEILEQLPRSAND